MGNITYSSTEERMGFAIASFFDQYPLYYNILTSLARVNTKSLPTMGVGFVSNVATLFYNPDFVAKLSGLELCVVLNHECQHLGLRHLNRVGDRDKRLANIAMDVLVNFNISEIKQISPDLYNSIMTQEKFKSLDKVDLRESTYEEIYNLIKEEVDQARDRINQMLKDGGFDTHEMWGSGNGEGGEDLTAAESAALDGLLKDSVKKLGGRDPGNIPGEMRREIEKLLTAKYDWRKALSLFAQTVATEDRQPTWRRPSRRFGVQSPGYKKDFRPRILVAIDNSGSISKEIYGLFMSHLVKIADVCDEVAVIGVDTRVNFEGKIASGKAPSFEDLNSGGGTSFQPAFDYAKAHEFDGMVYFTDGYAFDDFIARGVPVIFALCPGAKEVEGHRNIKIEEEKK